MQMKTKIKCILRDYILVWQIALSQAVFVWRMLLSLSLQSENNMIPGGSMEAVSKQGRQISLFHLSLFDI